MKHPVVWRRGEKHRLPNSCIHLYNAPLFDVAAKLCKLTSGPRLALISIKIFSTKKKKKKIQTFIFCALPRVSHLATFIYYTNLHPSLCEE